MMLINKKIMMQLETNGRKQQPVRGTKDEMDFKPVVKLFMPDGGATWLLSEVDPHDPDIAFGLCNLGMVSARNRAHARGTTAWARDFFAKWLSFLNNLVDRITAKNRRSLSSVDQIDNSCETQ